MAAVATLSQRMDYLIDQARSKRIVDHDLLNQIFIDVGQLEAPLEARLVEEFQNSLNVNEILEEFLNQSLIWVDDVSGRGKLVWFQKLLKTLDDHEELLTLANQLDISLNIQDQGPRIGSLPSGLNQILNETFEILGWKFARQFLNRLGLRQCQLHAIEDEFSTDLRFQNGMDQYIAHINNDPENTTISTTTDLYSHVISTLLDLRYLKVADQIENAGFLPLM